MVLEVGDYLRNDGVVAMLGLDQHDVVSAVGSHALSLVGTVVRFPI
jgi:hypothetical protein